VRLGDLAPFDHTQRAARPGHAEHLLDRQADVQGQVLPQVAEAAGDLDPATGRRQLSGDEAQQGRLAGAGGADQPGPAWAEHEAEPIEQDVAVRPDEPQVVDDDGVGHERLWGA
jgi:hypothetical protein